MRVSYLFFVAFLSYSVGAQQTERASLAPPDKGGAAGRFARDPSEQKRRRQMAEDRRRRRAAEIHANRDH